MSDFKSELRKIYERCDVSNNRTVDPMGYDEFESDIIALFISKGYMTGERWFGYFLQEFSGIPVNTEITINIDEIMQAAKRASGLADIKGELNG